MQFTTGDILETNSFTIPFSRHYAIYFLKDEIPYVAHNPLTPAITIEPFENFMRGRKFYRIVGHADMTDEQIYAKALELQRTKSWNLVTYSCEDFVREFCECFIGIDQRIIFWGLVLIVIAFLLWLIFR